MKKSLQFLTLTATTLFLSLTPSLLPKIELVTIVQAQTFEEREAEADRLVQQATEQQNNYQRISINSESLKIANHLKGKGFVQAKGLRWLDIAQCTDDFCWWFGGKIEPINPDSRQCNDKYLSKINYIFCS